MSQARKLIDVNTFIALVKKNAPYIYHMVAPIICMCPTVDAMEVVRCKDCKRCRQSVVTEAGRWRTVEKDGTFFFCKAFYRSGLDADDFCSYGERREEE